MTIGPLPSNLARLLHELSLRTGEDLERALADSAPMFSRLGPSAAPRIFGSSNPRRAGLSLARAERELSRLVVGELARLCEQAAEAQDPGAESRRIRRDLAALLVEELDCARTLDCVPMELFAHLRGLARRLSRGAGDERMFSEAAESIRAGGSLP